MAPRPYWTGYLKLSLVTCAVSLTPATSDREKVRFHTLNIKTGNRVRSRYVDAETGKPVGDDDEVRGYEIEEDRYVMLEDDELEAVGLESTRTIDIEQFVLADSIEWVWYDTPYYLMPDDEVAQAAFAVIREAMAATDTEIGRGHVRTPVSNAHLVCSHLLARKKIPTMEVRDIH